MKRLTQISIAVAILAGFAHSRPAGAATLGAVGQPHAAAVAKVTVAPRAAASDQAKSVASKGVPKTPRGLDRKQAADCTGLGVDSLYPSGAPPGKLGKKVKAYLATIRGYIPAYESKLQHPLGILVCLNWPKRYSQKADQYASTGVYDSQGGNSGAPLVCWIEINPRLLPHQPAGEVTNTLAHELFHCFQGVLAGLPMVWNPPSGQWVIEGQAEWAAAMVAGADPKDDPIWWQEYLTHPEVAPADVPKKHGYREIGFYAHLQESGINPWTVMAPMLEAPNDAAAFHAAVYAEGAARGQQFLDSWGSSFFRDPKRGRAWDIQGPGIPAGVAAVPKAISIAPGENDTGRAMPYTEGLFVLTSTAEIVELVPEGHVRISDGRTDLVLSDLTDFCIKKGGCQCPPGESYDGPPLVALDAQRVDIDLALTGAEDGAKAAVYGKSLQDYCKKQDPCLLGTWRVTDFVSYFNSLSAAGGGETVSLVGTSGTDLVTFVQDGSLHEEANSYTIVTSDASGADLTIVINGASTGKWSTPTQGTLVVTGHDISGKTVSVNGNTFTGNEFDLFGSTGTGSYTCTPSTLQLIPGNTPGAAPIVFARVK